MHESVGVTTLLHPGTGVLRDLGPVLSPGHTGSASLEVYNREQTRAQEHVKRQNLCGTLRCRKEGAAAWDTVQYPCGGGEFKSLTSGLAQYNVLYK